MAYMSISSYNYVSYQLKKWTCTMPCRAMGCSTKSYVQTHLVDIRKKVVSSVALCSPCSFCRQVEAPVYSALQHECSNLSLYVAPCILCGDTYRILQPCKICQYHAYYCQINMHWHKIRPNNSGERMVYQDTTKWLSRYILLLTKPVPVPLNKLNLSKNQLVCKTAW